MAISEIYNSLTFGDVNSLDYGIYISGPGVFDAPVRDVEFVNVPGRNGAIEIDKGRWNNIEVTYKAGTFGEDQSDFATKINAFRNAIVSQIGYQKLTDTYNPEEYRLGIYLSGLSVDPVNRNSAGEFDLVFNCKPQRYLLDGENKVVVSSGQTMLNPTLYDARPLLEIMGTGNLSVNGYDISISDETYGLVDLLEPQIVRLSSTKEYPLDYLTYDAGDVISIGEVRLNLQFSVSGQSIRSFQIVENSGDGTSNVYLSGNTSVRFEIVFAQDSTPAGTTRTIATRTVEFTFNIGTRPYRFRTVISTVYDATSETYSVVFTQSGTGKLSYPWKDSEIGLVSVNSTKKYAGNPTYIDSEFGDAYKFEYGEYVGLNPYVTLGSDLPKLSPGENEITFDSSITELKITPRWWEL